MTVRKSDRPLIDDEGMLCVLLIIPEGYDAVTALYIVVLSRIGINLKKNRIISNVLFTCASVCGTDGEDVLNLVRTVQSSRVSFRISELPL